jgi:(2Fe-2S) ferredoxin
MNKPQYHIFLCSSSRVSGEPKGVCSKKNSSELFQYLEEELADRSIEGVMVTNTGCFKQCDDGPIMVIYPQGSWYGQVNEEAIDTILDALKNGTEAKELLL